MSTYSQIEAALRFRLGNKRGHEADFLREIQFAQRRLEEDPTLEFWPLLHFSSIVLSSGNNDITFPADYIREKDDITPVIDLGAAFPPLRRMSYDDALQKYGVATGMPEAYVIADSMFKVFPIPDKQYVLRFAFIRREALLSTDNETNAWTENAEQLLMNKAGITLAQAFRDKDALASFTNDYQVAWNELITRITQKEVANFDDVRGEDY